MATNSIDTIFGFGEDALQNLYEVSLVVYPKKLSDQSPSEFITGRIQNFNIVGRAIETYDRHYKTQRIQIPNGKISSAKEATFQLRVDRDFVFYNILSEWVDLANSGKKQMQLGNMEDYLGTIVVKRVGNDLLPIDDSKGKNSGWKLNDAFIKSVGDIPLDYSSGEPINVDVTVSFSWVEFLAQSLKK